MLETFLDWLWITNAFLEYARFMQNDIPAFTAAIDETFGAGLKEARERLKLTQEAVAELMRERLFYDFRQTTVYKIESGKRGVTLGEGLALASIVNVPIESLVEASGNTVTALRQTASRELSEVRQNLRQALGLIALGNISRKLLETNVEMLRVAQEGFPKTAEDRQLDSQTKKLLAIDLEATIRLLKPLDDVWGEK
jgi:transcriptional regulator with XRE-family HTH domain